MYIMVFGFSGRASVIDAFCNSFELREHNIIKMNKNFTLAMGTLFLECVPSSECLPGSCFQMNPIPLASVDQSRHVPPWFKLTQHPFPRNLELRHRAGVSELGRDDGMLNTQCLREGCHTKKDNQAGC